MSIVALAQQPNAVIQPVIWAVFRNVFIGSGSAAPSTMTVLDSDGNSFTVGLTVLDSDGNAFIVTNQVLDSDGNSFTVI